MSAAKPGTTTSVKKDADSMMKFIDSSDDDSDARDEEFIKQTVARAGIQLDNALKSGPALASSKAKPALGKKTGALGSTTLPASVTSQTSSLKSTSIEDYTSSEEAQAQESIMEIIDQNEKKQGMVTEKAIEQANQLLSFEHQFFNFKKRLLNYKDYPQVAQMLFFDQETNLKGAPTCI